ncbi:uncharacterized protein OCT59_019568 [Rhizophagus irregularis]|uniref:uncharacterized protein n=1 Tax=Rhizophagus irregularis TaxID=588596 RepID=UPI0033285C6A|nr:hypothetical protein OCT59_019568 [Rhizophagus irregularis]
MLFLLISLTNIVNVLNAEVQLRTSFLKSWTPKNGSGCLFRRSWMPKNGSRLLLRRKPKNKPDFHIEGKGKNFHIKGIMYKKPKGRFRSPISKVQDTEGTCLVLDFEGPGCRRTLILKVSGSSELS